MISDPSTKSPQYDPSATEHSQRRDQTDHGPAIVKVGDFFAYPERIHKRWNPEDVRRVLKYFADVTRITQWPSSAGAETRLRTRRSCNVQLESLFYNPSVSSAVAVILLFRLTLSEGWVSG